MKNRNIKLMFFDSLIAIIAIYLSFFIRFEFIIPEQFSNLLKKSIPFFMISQVLVFYYTGLYARIWRYTSLFDLYAISLSVGITTVISITAIHFFLDPLVFPRSILVLFLFINGFLTVFIRLCVRIYYTHYHKDSPLKSSKKKKSLLLLGAGKTGEKIAREILTTSGDKYLISGFVDDNHEKVGALLHGKKVFCKIEDLPELKIRYDEILITAPSATGDQIRRIVEVCKQTGKKYKIVPGINEIIDGEVSLATIRDVSYSDLLGREEVKLDLNSIEDTIKGRRVLITGAGGSIGSELVRQCLAFKPSEIICVDNNEESIYKLDQAYTKFRTLTVIKTVLASVKVKIECEKVFSENRPHIVFHAAAYKHVPIQETHPWTAVTTNIKGTMNIVQLSDKYKVDKFVLVSTDKAVNPVNIMGATKRVAEKLIQSFNKTSNTTFMAVRFGNVLGSSGSAIPTFQEQINSGGPLTITHPEMTRYFMSIQEASQLILQCGALGGDGEIFLLEMGKPIRIVQMAKDLIRLSGLEPDVDIPIVFTGLRPGEKLYEELQMYEEKKVSTTHKKIMILKNKRNNIPWSIFSTTIKQLLLAAENLNISEIQVLLKQACPTYSPGDFGSDLQSTEFYKKRSIKIEA